MKRLTVFLLLSFLAIPTHLIAQEPIDQDMVDRIR